MNSINNILKGDIKDKIDSIPLYDVVVYDDYSALEVSRILKDNHNKFVKYLSILIKSASQIKTKAQLLKSDKGYLFNMSLEDLVKTYSIEEERKTTFNGIYEVIDSFISSWIATSEVIKIIDAVTSKYEEKYGVYESLFPQKEFPDTHNKVYEKVLDLVFDIINFDGSISNKIYPNKIKRRLFNKSYSEWYRCNIGEELYRKHFVEPIIHDAYNKLDIIYDHVEIFNNNKHLGDKPYCVYNKIVYDCPSISVITNSDKDYDNVSIIMKDLINTTGADHIIKDIMYFDKTRWYVLQDFDRLTKEKFEYNSNLREIKALEEYMELRCATIDGVYDSGVKCYTEADGVYHKVFINNNCSQLGTNIAEELADYAITNSKIIFSGCEYLTSKVKRFEKLLNDSLMDKVFITSTDYYSTDEINDNAKNRISRNVILNVCDTISEYKKFNKELKKKTK